MVKIKQTIILQYNKTIILLLLMFFVPYTIFPQVIEFLNLNQEGFYILPQEAGNHGYKYLLSNNLNNKKILNTQSFNSVLVTGDYKIKDGLKKIAVGGTFYFSKLVSNPLSDQGFYLTIAHHQIYRNNEFHFGFQPAILVRQLDQSTLTFPDQYDRNTGTFNPYIATGEIAYPYSKSFAYSINFGAGWTRYFQKFKTTIGFALRNINQPSLSISERPAYLYRNYLVSIKSTYYLSDLDLLQMYLLNNTSELLNELYMGAALIHKFEHERYAINSVSIGNQWGIRSKKYPNDIVFNAGFNLKKTAVGFAYSFNFMGHKKKIAPYNTFEISLIFKGIYEYYRQYTAPCKIL
jgi:hypothetical protein